MHNQFLTISDNIRLIGLSIYLPKSKTLILSDIHIGYEEALNKQGILIPRIYFSHLYEKTKNLIRVLDFKTVVINGDLKHEFGAISTTEWRHTLRFLDLFKDKDIYLIKGNHDTILGPIAEKRNIKLVLSYKIDNTLIIHGDKIIKQTPGIKTIIIGHEHPAITIQSQTRAETYKCFLIGKTPDKKHQLIVMPSYNEITEGTDIFKEQTLSPYLKHNLANFRVIVCGKELLDFRTIKEIKKKLV
jgi:uncharacterized protein